MQVSRKKFHWAFDFFYNYRSWEFLICIVQINIKIRGTMQNLCSKICSLTLIKERNIKHFTNLGNHLLHPKNKLYSTWSESLHRFINNLDLYKFINDTFVWDLATIELCAIIFTNRKVFDSHVSLFSIWNFSIRENIYNINAGC